jgi:hypothetical protein
MKRIILSIAILLSAVLGSMALAPTHSYAADIGGSKDQVCKGLGEVVGDEHSCKSDSNSSFDKLINTIINFFSTIVGIVSVVMLMAGGFKYVTSGGDTSKVTSAKNTIIYAVVGIIVVAFSQTLVKFVIAKATEKPKTTMSSQVRVV